jgi:hypothetical protein
MVLGTEISLGRVRPNAGTLPINAPGSRSDPLGRIGYSLKCRGPTLPKRPSGRSPHASPKATWRAFAGAMGIYQQQIGCSTCFTSRSNYSPRPATSLATGVRHPGRFDSKVTAHEILSIWNGRSQKACPNYPFNSCWTRLPLRSGTCAARAGAETKAQRSGQPRPSLCFRTAASMCVISGMTRP